MIVSFNHKGLEKFFKTGSTAGIQAKHKNKLNLQLAALHHATSPLDLATPPSWQLHALKGNLEGHWAMSVNGNWRLTFRFNNDGNAEIVDYQDYH
ncbi:type II toxin-antitoxin system RelE/ParE family toxin [Moraxella sp. Pampa]|uniref:type II toxin-antitoxin system RelE/ParE family toxin n=1 Tax=Moraxella sp. Pampa TaxID=3111978 RepID=UPI002B4016C8|nr:type II toxin-antitoxin system RelE/ParE family toxin [Moraxella sp. Pampa]